MKTSFQFNFTSSYRNAKRSMVWAMLCLALCMLGLGLSAVAQQPPIITFEAPHAGTNAGQGTFPWGIVQGGWIMGNYIDGNGVYHGFLRAPDGFITEFEPPDAGNEAGQGTVQVWGMSPTLEIVGAVADSSNVLRGFLRTLQGKFTLFEAGPALGVSSVVTDVEGVNPAGVILGDYLDANDIYHGFLRSPDGKIIQFDPPDAGSVPGSYQGTYPAIFEGISPAGATVGEYLDSSYVFHSFLRDPAGHFTEFDPTGPVGSGVASSGTVGINPAGEIAGWYFDTTFVFHGYVRAPDGQITEYDVPGSGTLEYQGTNACWYISCFGGISPGGTIAESYADDNNVYHGYVRTPEGKFIVFDAPGAGKDTWQGTQATAINPEGQITGYYTDKKGVVHGFVRLAVP